MQPDAPRAEAGLTRRARRTEATAPVAISATPEDSVTAENSRSALRRSAGPITASTVVWGAKREDAEIQEAEPSVVENVAVAEVAVAAVLTAATPISSRRRARMLAQQATTPVEVEPALVEADAESVLESEAVGITVQSAPITETIPVVTEDEFEIAARVFSFTGETPVIREPVAPASESSEPAAEDGAGTPASAFSRPARGRRARSGRAVPSARRVAAASFSFGVMGAVGLLTVAMAAPAEAVAAAVSTAPLASIQAPAATTESDDAEAQIQAFVAPSAETELVRDETYQTETFAQIAEATGISRHTDFFVNDPTAAIQWPFAVGVPISYGYGARWGSFHHGLDFTPGEGASIQAVADGTVRIATESGGAYGVYVVIDHVIDGVAVSSLYAHMLNGSLEVEPGQQVTVGTVLGHTGDTGLSFGAHTHFEITVNGTRVDPLPWLRENAGG